MRRGWLHALPQGSQPELHPREPGSAPLRPALGGVFEKLVPHLYQLRKRHLQARPAASGGAGRGEVGRAEGGAWWQRLPPLLLLRPRPRHPLAPSGSAWARHPPTAPGLVQRMPPQPLGAACPLAPPAPPGRWNCSLQERGHGSETGRRGQGVMPGLGARHRWRARARRAGPRCSALHPPPRSSGRTAAVAAVLVGQRGVQRLGVEAQLGRPASKEL